MDTQNPNKVYDAAIILGGYARQNTQGTVVLTNEGDRIWQGIKTYKQGQCKKIILTGGSGSILNPQIKEAEYISNDLIKLGIPFSDILIEKSAKNTFENAVNCSKIIQDSSLKSILLITSGFHMRRSAMIFKKILLDKEIEIDIFSAKNTTNNKYRRNIADYAIPSILALQRWQILIKEIIGTIVYTLKK